MLREIHIKSILHEMIPKLNQISQSQSHYLAFLEALKETGFKGDVCPDYANRTVLSTDNSVYQILPQGIVYPSSTDDLTTLTELSNVPKYQDIVLTARGGGTGTNGQSLSDGIVVDISKHMNEIIEINVEERWVRLQTGVVKDQLNAALKPYGLFFAPELSTSNRATIGGMINTDASGQGSCLYGKTRDHVLELKTVLADGSVVHSKTLSDEEFTSIVEQQDRSGLIHRLADNIFKEHKNLIDAVFPKLNRCLTGYDLAHIRDEDNQFNLNNLLCGSEGTLGFIAEAKLNLLPIPKQSALVIVKYADFEASLRDATELMNCGPTSIETIDSKVLNLAMNDFIWHQVETFFKDDTDQEVKGINLVEYTADSEDDLESKMAKLLDKLHSKEKPARIGYALAMGAGSVNKIWAMRKRAVGLLGNAKGEARPVAFVEDTAVPPENLADFIMEFRSILDQHKLSYGMFGHVDAGVLHVRPALDMKNPEHEKLAWEISDQVAALTQKYKGLLWGEHGKGVRSEYSPAFFGELYPQLQRIKAAFDPYNQLNPGKVATPSANAELLKISEVTTRGEFDRSIPVKTWTTFDTAVYCNGNGACHNWNYNDAMCPSWKGTRLRTHTPKGRASLVREWLRLLGNENTSAEKKLNEINWFSSLRSLPKRISNSYQHRKGEYDFSHEVYDSMAACLACKSCTGQCPIKVDVPEFRSKFLALYHTRYLRPLKDHLVASLEYILPIAAKAPAIYNGITQLGPVKSLLRHVAGFIDGPKLARRQLTKTNAPFADLNTLKRLSETERANTVVIVQDAFTSYFESTLIFDLIEALRTLGFNPVLAPYSPNGKPLHVHGFLAAFKRTATKNAKKIQRYNELGIAVVGVDPSMTLTYRGEYSKYLPSESLPEVKLIQEWLVEKQDILLAHKKKSSRSESFTLLPHCTEKTNASSSMSQWQRIFECLGATLNVKSVGCCGMAGTYGHETRNAETSATIYDQSWRPVVESVDEHTNMVATGYSCRCQVNRFSGVSIQHPLQALLTII